MHYIVLGSEIHIDMYDDRLEIQSPGGMFEGPVVQERDIHTIGSARRNPVIADLFHRMKYMERRGSGLMKIISETTKLPGYTEDLKPEFFSTPSDFRVVMKNVNYVLNGNTMQDTTQDTMQDASHDTTIDERIGILLAFCRLPKTRQEMQEHIGITNREHFRKAYLLLLLEGKQLQMTIPDKPNSRYQKYVTTTN